MTTEQLLRLAEESHHAFHKKQTVAALFLDAEAAFDKCWHSGIKFKLKSNLNLPNRMVRVLSSFLTDRSLTVFHEGYWSQKVQLKAGTPQGSPLSPLIYLIYVNDFPQEIKNTATYLNLRMTQPCTQKHIQSNMLSKGYKKALTY